jgi:hypothetical protein
MPSSFTNDFDQKRAMQDFEQISRFAYLTAKGAQFTYQQQQGQRDNFTMFYSNSSSQGHPTERRLYD